MTVLALERVGRTLRRRLGPLVRWPGSKRVHLLNFDRTLCGKYCGGRWIRGSPHRLRPGEHLCDACARRRERREST